MGLSGPNVFVANSANNKSHFAPGTRPSPARDDGRVSKAKSRACRAKASLFRHPGVSHRQCYGRPRSQKAWFSRHKLGRGSR
jgi:hypothetical protein